MQQASVILLHMPISGEQRYKLSKRRTQARSFPGVFWDSFTNHNTGNYLRHGINITTNQRLSPTLRGNVNTINDGDWQTSLSPPFSEGRGLYTGYSQTSLFPIFFRGGGVCTQANSTLCPRNHNRSDAKPLLFSWSLANSKWRLFRTRLPNR